jgi:hypothetical protein
MQKRLVIILAAMVFLLTAASALLWAHLQRTRAAEQQRAQALHAEAQARAEHEQRVQEMEREQARLGLQNKELANLTQTLRASEAKQSSNLTALAKQLSGAATNAAGEPTDPTGAKEGFSAMMEKMMKEPAMREMMRSQQKAMMNQMYGPLFKDLALTTEQKQQFMDLQLDHAMKGVEHAGALFTNNGTDKSEATQAMAEGQTELQASLKTLLGDDKFAQYEDYQKSIGERTQLHQFKQQLDGTDTPLQDGQMAQLLQIFKEEKARVPPVLSDDPSRSAEMWEAMKSEEKMNQHMQWQEQLHQRVLGRAGTALNPEQLKEYGGFLEQQLNMQRLGMKMARGMFGGDKPAPPGK